MYKVQIYAKYKYITYNKIFIFLYFIYNCIIIYKIYLYTIICALWFLYIYYISLWIKRNPHGMIRIGDLIIEKVFFPIKMRFFLMNNGQADVLSSFFMWHSVVNQLLTKWPKAQPEGRRLPSPAELPGPCPGFSPPGEVQGCAPQMCSELGKRWINNLEKE